MNRKAKQSAERAIRANGGVLVWWEHGQKHEIATFRTGSGHFVDISFARGQTDEVVIKRLVARKIREACSGLPPIGK